MTLLFGHRGTRTRFTENTLEAIEEAARCHADGVEVDVRPCASGEVVVMHDEELDRITEGEDEHRVAALSLSALRKVRLPHGERIPTLDDVLGLAADLDLIVNVELKRDVPSRLEAVRATAAVLGRHAPRTEILVSSFDPFMLAAMSALRPRVPAALLVEPEHGYLTALAGVLRCSAVHPAQALVRPKLVRAAHARGLRVHTWTVNDFEEARRLLVLGVDGIISDNPAKLLPLFR